MQNLFESIALLSPKGTIALAERTLMLHSLELMLIVIVPVFALIFFFGWWYRAGNTKAFYNPNWGSGKMDELVWWAIPFEIVLILGALTWSSTHQLDPRRPLDTNTAPLVIQVVALEWKWLFIYPEQHIATINYIRVPVGRPVRFDVTADAPMNSFWIPQWGGQIYAMTGMVNQLNLEASEAGVFQGGSANYSGPGFADMKFLAEATSQAGFDEWVKTARGSSVVLTLDAYNNLQKPSTTNYITFYREVENDLYNTIVEKFMGSAQASSHE